MKVFSISDVIADLKEEGRLLQENWRGDTADAYFNKVMQHYFNYANAIEKCLQGINQGLEEVQANIDDDTDSNYEHSPKKIK